MNLYFTGHGEKYAVEQTLLTLFPQERPVYPDTPPGGDNELELSFSRGKTWCTARATLRREGRTYTRQCRVQTSQLPQDDPVVATRLTRRTLQRAFYLAAVDCLGAEPPWGMLSGVRPVKLPTRALAAGAPPAQAEGMLRDQYHVSPLRRHLAVTCAQASRGVQASLAPQEISLYVGIPFCPTRCAYCSFISAAGSANRLIPQYLEALLTEIDAAGAAARQAGKTVRAVYIGGGTPTTLEADQLARLLERVGTAFALAPGTECTVEAGRPDTITADKLAVLKAHHVDRVSVNPQSMEDTVLEAMGRSHTAADILDAYAIVRQSGIPMVNMDLIAGLPKDSLEGFQYTLEQVLALAPENITVHTLALKKGSRLAMERQGLPSGAETAAMLEYAWKRLREAGYLPYYLYRQKYMSGALENIGWCKPGCEGIYNICIMEELHTILALGGGGSTKLTDPETGKIVRITNPKYPHVYLERVEQVCQNKAELVPFHLALRQRARGTS